MADRSPNSQSAPKHHAELPPPEHIAIIMDGNGRWAKARGLPRLKGHQEGARSVRSIVEESIRQGVRYLTLYAFSSENWSRPPSEVKGLMKLFERYLKSEEPLFHENGVQLRTIGEVERLPKPLQRRIQYLTEATEGYDRLTLVLAVSYGGRDELVRAAGLLARKVEEGELQADEISSEHFRSALYTEDIPDPDLLIRTSGECRISNFLLWQLAYSEFIFTECPWPEFREEQLKEAVLNFRNRKRRFGKIDEQLA